MAAAGEQIIYRLSSSLVNAGEDRFGTIQRVVSGTIVDLAFIAALHGDVLADNAAATAYADTPLAGPVLVFEAGVSYDATPTNNRWRYPGAPPGGGSTVIVSEGGTPKSTADTINFDDTDFNVSESPAGTANVSLNYGTGANQPAEGSHTHAQLHNAVTVSDSTSIDLTLTGQQVSATAIFGTGSGVVAEGNHNHTGIYQPLDPELTTIAGLADPNADRILFWDDSAGQYAYLTAGANLTISGTTIDAAGGSGLSHGQVMRRLSLRV